MAGRFFLFSRCLVRSRNSQLSGLLQLSCLPKFNSSGNSKTTYRNRYSHYRYSFPGKTNYGYNTFITFMIILVAFLSLGGGRYLDYKEHEFFVRKREERKKKGVQTVECLSEPVDVDSNAEDDKPTKKHVGFRDRKFIAYEDRIRAYSTPDKIFRYFATLKSVDEDGETVYMTPEDFFRSITPGIRQPEGLDLDSFKRYDPKSGVVWFQNKMEKLELDIPKKSVFYRLCDKALLTFTDFVFLLMVLSTPRRQFEIAFRIFDLNGDGELDAAEFDVVRSVIMDTTAMGRRHRDHSTTGSTLKPGSNSALQQYFFGPNGDQKLTIAKFLQFHTDLQEEITQLEFNRADPKDGKITEIQFANSLLTYAGFSENKKRKMIRRVKQKFPADSEKSEGISFKDFSDFSSLLRSISDVDTALTFYHMAGAAIDTTTFSHVASTVADIKLPDHVIDVVFTLFDENMGGMAPRTFQWPKRESSLPNDASNLVALVLENSEVFESEAAELTIEEADDYSSSLLLRNDWSSTDSILPELINPNRNSPVAHSAHSLATTSVVTSTQHAQIVEFSLLSLPETLSSAEDYLGSSKTTSSSINHSTQQGHNFYSLSEPVLSASDILDRIDSFISTSSIHTLSLGNAVPNSCPPSSWPYYLLGHTDAPALVEAIKKDMSKFLTNLFNTNRPQTQSITVLSCDEASDLTTCELTCCEADIEVLDCCNSLVTATGLPSDTLDKETTSMHSTASNKRCVAKRPRTSNIPFVLGYNEHCLRPLDNERIFLTAYSGLQPETNEYNCTGSISFTAAYILLIPDSSPCTESLSTPTHLTGTPASLKRFCLSTEQTCSTLKSDDHSNNSVNNNRNDHQHSNNRTIFAMLGQLVPSFNYSNFCKRPIHLDHQISESDFVQLSAIGASHQHFITLVAIVDLVPTYDDSGILRLKIIVHQRLHHAPELTFRLQSCP